MMNRNDYFLAIAVLTLALALFYVNHTQNKNNTVITITRQKEIILQQPLELFPEQYTLKTIHGSMEIIKENMHIAVKSSPCPDKICEKKGFITNSGAIICVPEETIIELSDGQEVSFDTIIK